MLSFFIILLVCQSFLYKNHTFRSVLSRSVFHTRGCSALPLFSFVITFSCHAADALSIWLAIARLSLPSIFRALLYQMKTFCIFDSCHSVVLSSSHLPSHPRIASFLYPSSLPSLWLRERERESIITAASFLLSPLSPHPFPSVPLLPSVSLADVAASCSPPVVEVSPLIAGCSPLSPLRRYSTHRFF